MDRLVSRYYSRLYTFAYRMLHDREAAEDVAQETLLRVFRHASRFRDGSRFAAWLLTIAANLCRTELSRRSRRPQCEWEALESLEAPGSVEDTALRRLEGDAVHRALQGLSPEHRMALILFYYEGLSHAEIARACGCAVGTVKSRLHYALARLRSMLLGHTRETQAMNGERALP
jgi:RNA polymerase sigma-70 factor (ECF subfamily)